MSTKHTPGTMEVDQLGEGQCVVLHHPGGHQVIECGYNATAQEIARRWNTHPDLLAALRSISDIREPLDLLDAKEMVAWMRATARAALAKAEVGAR